MKRILALSVVALMSASLVVVPSASAVAAPAESPTLWLTATRNDGTGNTFITYHTDLAGNLVETPFATPNTAISSIAVDPRDRTLWGANEGSSSGTPPGKLVNYKRDGTVITEIPAGLFGAVGTEGLALTVSPSDDTLWVVDDPAGADTPSNVYHIQRNGDLISTFPTSKFDPKSTSPQSIAYDPYTATLWIADNSTEKVYNIEQNGMLISSFATNSAVFEGHAGGKVRNVQGISVESSEVLWLTARDTDRVYRVSKSGATILSSLAITDVEAGTFDPTGVAFDRPPGDVGAAAGFGILGLPGAKLQMKDVDKWTGVVGDVGLAADAEQDFDEGLLTGSYVVDPDADDSNSNDVVISGGKTTAGLALVVSDAKYASLAASALTPTQTFGEIKTSKQIVGGSGLTVVEAVKIELDGDETLTLVGDASSIFVFNLDEKLKLKNRSAVELQGGVTAHNVFFNILGTDDSSIESESFAVGTIIAPDAKLKIKNQGSVLVGRMFSGEEVKLEDGGRLRLPSLQLDAGELGAADDAAVLALPDAKVKINDAGSVITGDVVLGPFAQQDFSKGTIDGDLVVDPAADNDHDNDVVITGGTIVAQASQAVADAIDASYAMAHLPVDQVFGEIKSDAAVAVGSGLNVLFAKKIELDGDETLTITGPASARVVVNVDERFKLKEDSSVVLTGGLSADNVTFNVLDSSEATVESGSAVSGTVLAPWASKLKVKESGTSVTGAVIGGGEIIIEQSGAVIAS